MRMRALSLDTMLYIVVDFKIKADAVDDFIKDVRASRAIELTHEEDGNVMYELVQVSEDLDAVRCELS